MSKLYHKNTKKQHIFLKIILKYVNLCYHIKVVNGEHMKKLLIKIKDNALVIKERKKLSTEYKNIINTNVISCNELVFSDEYILDNPKIVSAFLNEITKTYNANTIIIENNDFTLMFLKLLKNVKSITTLIINDDTPLTFAMCEAIMQSYIKNVNCYALQPFMIEYLDKYNILVETRSEILFLSNFMIENDLNQFSSLFYKMTLKIEFPMNEQDEQDFEAFCKINKYLKTINVNTVNKNDLEFLINTLKKNSKKNIKIVIHENINNEEVAEYLRKFNKRKSKKLKIIFKLDYSNDYLRDNLFKQANVNLLKMCSYLILLIVVFTFGYVFYDNYKSMKNVEEIREKITQVIEISDSEKILEELNENKVEDERKAVNEKIAALIQENPDTVAWLKVNNTNIDYPVVKSNNNEYYLNHNFYMEDDYNGWVFMDYRNNTELISDNLIIYAHNRYSSGVMFGTLQNALRYSWYTDPSNQIISLETLYDSLDYQIFSIYKISVTTDYMQTIFADDTSRLEFYNMLKDRSIYNFDVTLNGDDKILTLSTCADEDNRYVIHAVLINK